MTVVHLLTQVTGHPANTVIAGCGATWHRKPGQPLPAEVTAWAGAVTCDDCRARVDAERAELRAVVERLRAEVAGSFAWRRKVSERVVRVSAADYDTLSPSARGECQWRPDVGLIEELVAAERAITATYKAPAPYRSS